MNLRRLAAENRATMAGIIQSRAMANQNHPNRSSLKTPASRPPPEAIAALRKANGLTQREAANLIYATERSWQAWEEGHRPMHAGLWELFKLKTGDVQTRRLVIHEREPDTAR